MPIYDIYVVCDQCSQPHSVHVELNLESTDLDGTRLGAYFAERPLPSRVVFMQTNKYRCPHTKQLFPADDIDKAVFFARQSRT